MSHSILISTLEVNSIFSTFIHKHSGDSERFSSFLRVTYTESGKANSWMQVSLTPESVELRNPAVILLLHKIYLHLNICHGGNKLLHKIDFRLGLQRYNLFSYQMSRECFTSELTYWESKWQNPDFDLGSLSAELEHFAMRLDDQQWTDNPQLQKPEFTVNSGRPPTLSDALTFCLRNARALEAWG